MAEADDQSSMLMRGLRDSALVLAGGTVLLYVASAIFAGVYLDTLGVPPGYHPFGVGELSIIAWYGWLVLLGGVWVIYVTLTTLRYRVLVVGATLIVVASAAPAIARTSLGLAVRTGDFAVIVASVTLAGIIVWTRLIIRASLKRSVEQKVIDEPTIDAMLKANETMAARAGAVTARLRQFEALVSTLEADVSERKRRFVPAVDLHEKEAELAEARKALSGQQEIMKSLREVIDSGSLLSRALKVSRARYALLAGAIACLSLIPSLAFLQALGAVSGERWKAEAGEIDRTPVYWTADRFVYITDRPDGCWVHLVTAGHEEAQRRCPDLVRAIEP